MKKFFEVDTCTFILLVLMSVGLKILIYVLIGEERRSFLLEDLLIYGFGFIILGIIAGHIHNRVIEQGKEACRLQDWIRQFVKVNVDTEFDNISKMQRIDCHE